MDVCSAAEVLQAIVHDPRVSVKVFVTQKISAVSKRAMFFKQTASELTGDFKVNVPGDDAPSMKYSFDRPRWTDEFGSIDESGTRWVYCCGSDTFIKDVTRACNRSSEASGQIFVVTGEEF